MNSIYRRRNTSRDRREFQDALAGAFEDLGEQFELVRATTRQDLDQVYSLRYQIYCVECGFEDPGQFPDHRERDDWDRYSKHLLVRHCETDTTVATARLIFPDQGSLAWRFPVEEHTGIDPAVFSASSLFLPRSSLGEVSRFAISKEARRYLREAGGMPAAVSDKVFGGWLTLSLIWGLCQLSEEHGVAYWYTMMEAGFIRLFKRLGLYFDPIGESVDFNGRRYPSLEHLGSVLKQMDRSQPALFEKMTNTGGCRSNSLTKV